MKTDLIAISDALLAARQSRTPLDGFPGELPATLDEAYAVQLRSLEQDGRQVLGWKVGGVPADFVERFQATRLGGPVFADLVKMARQGDHVDMPVYKDGFAAVEAEYVVKLGGVPNRDVTLDDMAEIVASIHIGVEIASSPMPMVNALGPQAIISDFGNNCGMIVGPEIPMDTDFSNHIVRVTIDGEVVGAKPSGTGDAGPFGAVMFVINHLRAVGVNFPIGTYVTTGAVSGVHDAVIGSHSRVEFEGLGELFVNFVELK